MNKINRFIFVCLLFIANIAVPLAVKSQVKINEFSSSNTSIINDPDYNETADWLELYNGSKSDINLYGYYITDDFANPSKWQINIDANIPSNGYIIIWMDGNNKNLHTSFKLSADGEQIGIFSPSLNLVDSVTYPPQIANVSMGRKIDGIGEFVYFLEPTPGKPNSNLFYDKITFNLPVFSKLGGIFNSPQNITLKTIDGGNIKYTIDGSDPDGNSATYSSPLYLDTTTIIRARIIKNGEIPGPIITNSYFIDEHLFNSNLPVFSMNTNPENFWDAEKGIYVQDFKPEWEIPVNLELFENDGSDRAAFNLMAGVKINGLHAWALPQKMLGVYFRGKYGAGKLDYHLFTDDPKRNYYDNFALRASGNDWCNTMLKDGMLEKSIEFNMNLDILNYRPSILFVDAKYMGIHNIRSKVDLDYILSKYDIPNGNVDIIENENVVNEGKLDEYNYFKSMYSKDLSIQSNFEAVVEIMDIENFTDYIITQIYTANTSVGHNIVTWKPQGKGKWKWILMDLDRAFTSDNSVYINYFTEMKALPFANLLQNDNYKSYFIKRMASQLFTTFHPKRMKQQIKTSSNRIKDEMPYHIERWKGTTSIEYGDAIPSIDFWNEEIVWLENNTDQRASNLLNDLKQFGYDSTSLMNIFFAPRGAGKILFNDLKLPEKSWSGIYPNNLDINLKANIFPGHRFIGWAECNEEVIIPKGSIWKYWDNGDGINANWINPDFIDIVWKEGEAQLGYGEGDENTIVSYGPEKYSKYITTYFRNTFNLTKEQFDKNAYAINLLCDDGAVVYVNGKEAVSYNMYNGDVTYQSNARKEITGEDENVYFNFIINPDLLKLGENVISVEVHQKGSASDDLSFDLELVAYVPDTTKLLSANDSYDMQLTGDKSIMAVYERVSQCFLPPVITENIILTSDCSPILVNEDIFIDSNATVLAMAGTEFWMAPNTHIYVSGNLYISGIGNKHLKFKIHPDFEGSSWGGIIFKNSSERSYLSYVDIEDATNGYHPIYENAAISSFHAELTMDNVNIINNYSNPIITRYSNILLTNSTLHSEVTGDLINCKYGSTYILNCNFIGNDQPDTDAIDYDNIIDGVIRNCNISNFFGLNSDAIDIGERTLNVKIDSVYIHDITDKGVSFGQFSSGKVINSVFVNCNLGLGLKDSCQTEIQNCTFYNVGIPVSAYEKNIGSLGGNGHVINSILSNSIDASYFCDNHSTLSIEYSLSDNDTLPENRNNLFGNPEFESPNFYDFSLKSNSPAINAANPFNGFKNLGSNLTYLTGQPNLIINEIFPDALKKDNAAEFLSIENIADEPIDISGYAFVDGIDFMFPNNSLIAPGEKIYITKDAKAPQWNNWQGQLFEWTSGSLANEGESVILINNFGMTDDKVHYLDTSPWPLDMVTNGDIIELNSNISDNHFGENWIGKSFDSLFSSSDTTHIVNLNIYPNPSTGKVFIRGANFSNSICEVFDITGKLVLRKYLSEIDNSINMENFLTGIYFIRIKNKSVNLILLR
ncbi:MAG: hypothetical protein A2X64_04445 [Ignavibacteria bacterium GWF2_33_9]|nr:MAG: hypothetical protein A2X64_04445 [Ignavibacteria bacterium GWF2_33_9]